MGLRYDTDKLLAQVKRDCFTAQSDDNWDDANILGVADDCGLEHLAPVMKSTRQSWFRADASYTLVAGQTSYDLPEGCMWLGVDAIHLVNIADGSIAGKLSIVDASSRGLYQTTQGTPAAFWFDRTTFTLNATPSTSDVSKYSLLVSYYRRPAQLVRVIDTAAVLTLNSGTKTVTSSTPAYFSALTTPYSLDIYSKDYPHTLKINATVSTTLSPFVFSGLSAADFAKIAVGDIISIHGSSCLPDYPADVIPYLKRLTCQSILMSQTDPQGFSTYAQQQGEALGKFLRGIANRADGAPRKLSLYQSAAAHLMGVNRIWRGNG